MSLLFVLGLAKVLLDAFAFCETRATTLLAICPSSSPSLDLRTDDLVDMSLDVCLETCLMTPLTQVLTARVNRSVFEGLATMLGILRRHLRCRKDGGDHTNNCSRKHGIE
jgi:hypothetical protein